MSQLRHIDLSFNEIGEDGVCAIECAAKLHGRTASVTVMYKSAGHAAVNP